MTPSRSSRTARYAPHSTLVPRAAIDGESTCGSSPGRSARRHQELVALDQLEVERPVGAVLEADHHGVLLDRDHLARTEGPVLHRLPGLERAPRRRSRLPGLAHVAPAARPLDGLPAVPQQPNPTALPGLARATTTSGPGP